MELLKQNIAKNVNLSDDEWQHFLRPFKLKEVKKKEFLLKQGEVCRFEAFVNKGCLRVFYIDKNGFEHVLYFAVEGWWVGDIDSFTNQVPAQLFIEALENCELLMVGKEDKEALYETLPIVERLFRIMSQKRVIAFQQRIIDTQSKTAEERYNDFITKYPQIVQRITNLQLAAYLGISHEFLSKIRKKRSQKNI